MAEIKTLAYGESFSYKGLIDVKDLYRLLDKWFKEHGYDKNELWNFEEVYEDGKQITLKIQPYKKLSDYAKVEIRITVTMKRLKEVEIEKKTGKIKILRGEASFVFDVFLTTDYEEHWEQKPIYFFFKTVAEKFLYRSYIDKFEEQAMKDKDAVKRELKSYLNMQRF